MLYICDTHTHTTKKWIKTKAMVLLELIKFLSNLKKKAPKRIALDRPLELTDIESA